MSSGSGHIECVPPSSRMVRGPQHAIPAHSDAPVGSASRGRGLAAAEFQFGHGRQRHLSSTGLRAADLTSMGRCVAAIQFRVDRKWASTPLRDHVTDLVERGRRTGRTDRSETVRLPPPATTCSTRKPSMPHRRTPLAQQGGAEENPVADDEEDDVRASHRIKKEDTPMKKESLED